LTTQLLLVFALLAAAAVVSQASAAASSAAGRRTGTGLLSRSSKDGRRLSPSFASVPAMIAIRHAAPLLLCEEEARYWGASSDISNFDNVFVRTVSSFPRGGALATGEDDEEEDSEAEESEEEYDTDDEEEEEYESDEEDDVVEVTTSVEAAEYDEPLVASPLTNLYASLGVMLLARRVDLFSPKVVRIARYYLDLFDERS